MDTTTVKLELAKIDEALVKLSQREPKNVAEFNAIRYEYDKLDLKRTMLMKAMEGKE